MTRRMSLTAALACCTAACVAEGPDLDERELDVKVADGSGFVNYKRDPVAQPLLAWPIFYTASDGARGVGTLELNEAYARAGVAVFTFSNYPAACRVGGHFDFSAPGCNSAAPGHSVRFVYSGSVTCNGSEGGQTTELSARVFLGTFDYNTKIHACASGQEMSTRLNFSLVHYE